MFLFTIISSLFLSSTIWNVVAATVSSQTCSLEWGVADVGEGNIGKLIALSKFISLIVSVPVFEVVKNSYEAL